ncbi:MAG: hypothetical protein FWE16_01975 [Firmicutes bacterium]|nr:hypothetical protein [Bacillota bacterium]
MKKFIGGFVFILVAIMLFAIIDNASAKNLNVPINNDNTEQFQTQLIQPLSSGLVIETDTAFPWRQNFFRREVINGLFIFKSNENVSIGPSDTLFGSVFVDRNPVTSVFHYFSYFTFTSLFEVDGVWLPSDRLIISECITMTNVEWELNKNLPFGRYAIRVQAHEEVLVDGEWIRRPAILWGQPVVGYYIIHYADSLRYITATSGAGTNTFDARTHGAGRTLAIDIGTNSGAMDMDLVSPDETRNGFSFGNYHHDINLRVVDMEVSITRNGFPISFTQQGEQSVPGQIAVSRSQGQIFVTLPPSIATGRFVVTVTHPISEEIFGTFVIDNNVHVPFGYLDLTGAVPAMMILAVIFALAAVGIFVWPKLAFAREQRRFEGHENLRYMTEGEGAKDDHHFKAQSAKSALEKSKERVTEDVEKETKGKRFLDTMRESRQKREMARDAGLTMEEYRELEKRQKKVEDAKRDSLGSFREAIDAHLNAPVEEPVKPEIKAEGDEFALLDSLKDEATVLDETIIKGAIQPNVSGGSSILSNLRDMSGNKETERENVTHTQEMEYAHKSNLNEQMELPNDMHQPPISVQPQPLPPTQVSTSPPPVAEAVPMPTPQPVAPTPVEPVTPPMEDEKSKGGILSRIRNFTENQE